MQVHTFDTIHPFYAQVADYLLQHEVAHNLLLRICRSLLLAKSAPPATGAPYLASVTAEGAVVAVAIQTPPFPLVLSEVGDQAAIALLAQTLAADCPNLPGVNGPEAVSTAFADHWQRLTGRSTQVAMALRIHQLTQVVPPFGIKGALRPATEADRPTVRQWHQEFEQEALGELSPQSDSDRWFDQVLAKQSAYLWWDGEPVAIACGIPFTDHSIGLNLVYTPPRFRRRGYGSACVAALSQHYLEHGYQRCVLFTDLAQPTPNKIYRAVGYLPVCDWKQYTFGA